MADKKTLFIQKIINSLTWLGVILMALVPENWIIGNGKSLCLHKLLTGHECPLCGMTKASWSLSHFQFLRAVTYNPVSFLLLAILVLWTIKIWFKVNTGKTMYYSLWILLACFAVLYISRFFQAV